jgi:hypothetical protein
MMLLPTDRMPIPTGIAVPAEAYVVLNTPATLAGMSYPSDQRWAGLFAVGIKWVVCLTEDMDPYNPAPLQIGHCSKLTDLYGGRSPSNLGQGRNNAFAPQQNGLSSSCWQARA